MSTLKVNTVLSADTPTVNITDGLNVTGVSTVAALNATSIVNATPLSHRNIIINGGMTVKQRADLTMTTTSTYSVDRWRAAVGSSFNWSSATVTQSTTSPDGFGKSLKVDIASTSTPTGSHNGLIQTKIEGQDLQQLAYGTSSAKQCTLSFYVRSNKTGTYCVQVANTANSKYVLFDYTINSADTWERKSVTFSGNTANTLNNDSALGFDVNFHLATGSDDHVSATSTWTTYSGGSYRSTSNQVNLFDSASNEWYLTGCQLEIGSVATPFEHRSFGDELERCRRYLQIIKGGSDDYTGLSGYSESTSNARFPVYFRPPMRSDPTFSMAGTLRFQGGTNDSATFTSGLVLQQVNSTFDGASLQLTGSSGMGANDRPGNLQFKASNSSISFDAEL